MTLLQEMIDDVLALHPKSQFIHIGCDEVYYMGQCGQCHQRMQQMGWSSSGLFLDHMITVAGYIKSKKPSMTVLAWDDMMRRMSLSELLRSKVGDVVEPVVWGYHGVSRGTIQYSYNQAFKGIWIASSFKGAQGPDSMLTDIGR
ncbi:hexosaminidase D [Nilaparvata lugens]|uniref:hexosaminidase D n=1 Tax=Nilaparvata lugens TaxID=108931 RepID=UPI00193CA450|nr:hexosaminidase D [Nilaparvata lugens]